MEAMTKRQIIDEILTRNTTADAGFLARFDDAELDEYLTNLRRLQTPRLNGDPGRYEKYFAFTVPTRPVEQQETVVCPCLPEEENDVDDSFWHLDQEFESDDDELRRRVDRFAEQLIGRMSHPGERQSDGEDRDDGEIVYHRTGSSLDDGLEESFEETQEEDEAFQHAGASSDAQRRDNDSWLF